MPAAGGAAEWPLVIPNTTALTNLRLHQQAFALDAGAHALGLAVSNAVEMTIGIR